MLEPVVPDGTLARRLALHEASVHAWGRRELRDLGDAHLLHDPGDREPFWNRIVAPAWPSDAKGFDRRLDEVVTLFATLDRRPHVRTLSLGDRPVDLAVRLAHAGFTRAGSDSSMALLDPEPSLALARTLDARRGLSLEHVGEGPEARAMDVARILVGAFEVETDRAPALAAETVAATRRAGGAVLLLLEAGVPAAVARRVSADGGTYLSSIATAPALQGRGYGSLVTALAVAEGLAAGAAFVHLLAETGNDAAARVYGRLGFVTVGAPILGMVMG